MSDQKSGVHSTLALSTKLEEEFVAPLTAVRGALEILRDFPDLSAEERGRFVRSALEDCARLEAGVEQLADNVYAAGQRASQTQGDAPDTDEVRAYKSRIRFLETDGIVEVDFSDLEFSSSSIVNGFYDVLDELILATGRQWYFVIDYAGCSIWPEAWVAFAHRGKQATVTYSLATARFNARMQGVNTDPSMFESRGAALAYIDQLRGFTSD